MDFKDVLPTIVDGSGKSMQSISTAMGKSRSYLSNTVTRGRAIQTDTLARIADVCGYDLKLVKRDGTETIIIDPPVREVSTESNELDTLMRKLE